MNEPSLAERLAAYAEDERVKALMAGWFRPGLPVRALSDELREAAGTIATLTKRNELLEAMQEAGEAKK